MLWYPTKPKYMLKGDDATWKRVEAEQPQDPQAQVIYWSAMTIRFRMGSVYYSRVSFWWSMFSIIWATISLLISLWQYA